MQLENNCMHTLTTNADLASDVGKGYARSGALDNVSLTVGFGDREQCWRYHIAASPSR
jgi:hypothetical protein